MAVSRKPKIKYAQRFGLLPEGATIRKHRRRPRKKSDYGVMLEEKQKLKFIYKIMERQLAKYAREAFSRPGNPAETILQTLETRLDNVIYRLGFAKTREQARQIVGHGLVLVDGRRIDIPSYNVFPGQEIELKEKMYKNSQIQENIKNKKPEMLPSWLNREENKGKINHIPSGDELRRDINMSYIVEFYS